MRTWVSFLAQASHYRVPWEGREITLLTMNKSDQIRYLTFPELEFLKVYGG